MRINKIIINDYPQRTGKLFNKKLNITTNIEPIKIVYINYKDSFQCFEDKEMTPSSKSPKEPTITPNKISRSLICQFDEVISEQALSKEKFSVTPNNTSISLVCNYDEFISDIAVDKFDNNSNLSAVTVDTLLGQTLPKEKPVLISKEIVTTNNNVNILSRIYNYLFCCKL